jgi:hypothetical protein
MSNARGLGNSVGHDLFAELPLREQPIVSPTEHAEIFDGFITPRAHGSSWWLCVNLVAAQRCPSLPTKVHRKPSRATICRFVVFGTCSRPTVRKALLFTALPPFFEGVPDYDVAAWFGQSVPSRRAR